MRVLVTGGAGYIGSHTVVQLLESGHEPVIVDSLANSKRAVLSRIEHITGHTVPLRELDLRDTAALDPVFREDGPFDAVIHFAGLKAVGESTEIPLDYYDNNIGGSTSLLRVMDAHGVHTLVFSSSATVYGPDAVSPLTEELPTSATNPYGWTKVMIEQILRDVAAADSRWRIALLRYFNPVGAHPSGLIGEDPAGRPNNLMPFVAQVAVGKLERLQVFGDDYDTVDGTGVRDYIHVQDLAAGHLAAMAQLTKTDKPISTWNLGTGQGTSVLQLVHAFERASGREIPYQIVGRRPGDVATCFADPSEARIDLDWKADRTIDDMCEDSWRWQSRNPNGYPDDEDAEAGPPLG